jgi:hypothetical protein
MRHLNILFASLLFTGCTAEVTNLAAPTDPTPVSPTGTGGAGGAAPEGTAGTGGCAGTAGTAGTGGGAAGTAVFLDPVGAPAVAPDAVMFLSECHDDEVATGILVSGDASSTIGLEMLCHYKSDDGLLGTARQSKQRYEGPPVLYGGGCPGVTPVAYGIVLSYGLEPSTQRNIIRDIGLICGPGMWPSAPPAERVIVREPSFMKKPFPTSLENPTSFQLECGAGKYLTGATGIQEPTASTPNSLVRIGAVCDIR